MAGVSFVHQTLAGNWNINPPFILLSRLKLNVNVNVHSLRNVEFLNLSTCRTDYGKYEPINRMISDVNEFPGFDVLVSFFACTLNLSLCFHFDDLYFHSSCGLI